MSKINEWDIVIIKLVSVILQLDCYFDRWVTLFIPFGDSARESDCLSMYLFLSVQSNQVTQHDVRLFCVVPNKTWRHTWNSIIQLICSFKHVNTCKSVRVFLSDSVCASFGRYHWPLDSEVLRVVLGLTALCVDIACYCCSQQTSAEKCVKLRISAFTIVFDVAHPLVLSKCKMLTGPSDICVKPAGEKWSVYMKEKKTCGSSLSVFFSRQADEREAFN